MILFAIPQDRETDFSYGIQKIGNLQTHLCNMRNDGKYDTCYQDAANLVGPPVSRSDKKHNYTQLYYQVIDTIKGMLIERFQDRKRFEFVDLIIIQNVSGLGKGKYLPTKLIFWNKCMGLCVTCQCFKVRLFFCTGMKIFIKKIAWNY